MEYLNLYVYYGDKTWITRSDFVTKSAGGVLRYIIERELQMRPNFCTPEKSHKTKHEPKNVPVAQTVTLMKSFSSA